MGRTISNPEGTDKVAGEFDTEQYCGGVKSKMFKLISMFLLLCTFPDYSFAESAGNPRTISLQIFKDRFTTGELIDISAAYAGDVYIRTVVNKLSEMGSVELDSVLIKNSMEYLATKSIISMDRAINILK